jgi:hypothetical protein
MALFIGKGRMQRRKLDAPSTRVSVDHGGVLGPV